MPFLRNWLDLRKCTNENPGRWTNPWKPSLHAHYWSSSNPPYPIHPLPPFPRFFYLLLILFSHVFFILPLLCFSTHYCVVICTLGLEIVGFAITLQLKVLAVRRGLLKRGWNHKNLGIFFEFLKNCMAMKKIWKRKLAKMSLTKKPLF